MRTAYPDAPNSCELGELTNKIRQLITGGKDTNPTRHV